MKVTVLGTANAWGPNPFLMPSPLFPLTGTLGSGRTVEIRKFRTSLLVETEDGKKILVDCGPDFSHQLKEFGFGELDAILITHPHLDHIGGLDELNLYRKTARLPIPTYATRACWDCIKNQRGLGYVVDPLRLVSENVLSTSAGTRSLPIGSVTVIPFDVEHHPIAPGAVGFVFEESKEGHKTRILYTGDLWAVSNPNDDLFSEPLDVAIIECDRARGLAGSAFGGGHMSFEEAVRMLRDGVLSRSRPKQVVFVHFGDDGPNGTASTYDDWRNALVDGLRAAGLQDVMWDPDKVVGYEGLVL